MMLKIVFATYYPHNNTLSIFKVTACSGRRPAVLHNEGTIQSPSDAMGGSRRPYTTPTDYGWDPEYGEEFPYDPYGNYPNQADCSWELRADAGHVSSATCEIHSLYCRMYNKTNY